MLGLDDETNAYRVVHAEGDGLSGLIVDRFDDVLSVEIFSLGMYQRIGPILELCRRPAGDASTSGSTSTSGSRWPEDFPGRPARQPRAPAPGDDPASTASVTASTSRGATRPASSATSATTAATWPGSAHDRTVLDVCCYTGGFGLNALVRGKAREVTCVDLDEKAIALARENANANQVRLDAGPRRRLRLHAADGRRTAGRSAWSCSTRPS